ncbi:MAG: hypothetical protein IJB90_01995 [Clostridia bacterium]|nr:hypothetical protein [Clostridia bacterium]
MNEGNVTIIENARSNRDDLIISIEARIKQLEILQKECNEKIEEYLKNAEENDIRYNPDTEILTKISYWIENLENVKQVLGKLKLNENSILFDDEKYLNAAQELLRKIDKRIEEVKAEFIKSNEEKIQIACKEKRDIDEELEELRMELERLKEEKEEYESWCKKIEGKKFFKRLFAKEKEYYQDFLEIVNTDIRKVEKRISQIEIRKKANHFVPRTEEDPVNPDSAEIMEENKGIEPGDE